MVTVLVIVTFHSSRIAQFFSTLKSLSSTLPTCNRNCFQSVQTKKSRQIKNGQNSLAGAKGTSVDTAVVAVLSEPVGIFSWKKEQNTAPKAFLCVSLHNTTVR